MSTYPEAKGTYPESTEGNFSVIGSVGVPHPYVIGARHIEHAAEHHGGMIDKHSIESAEKNGRAHCYQPGCHLRYDEHEQALLIGCKAHMKADDGTAVPELHEYLIAIKAEAEANNYAGFAFVDRRG